MELFKIGALTTKQTDGVELTFGSAKALTLPLAGPVLAASLSNLGGKVCGLDEMLPEYYSLRGWTKDGELTTGVRTKFSLPM